MTTTEVKKPALYAMSDDELEESLDDGEVVKEDEEDELGIGDGEEETKEAF